MAQINPTINTEQPNMINQEYLNGIAEKMDDDFEDFDIFQDTDKQFFQKLITKTPISIEYRNLTYTVSQGKKKSDKVILSNFSGKINSGEITAIMGPSGAGKTTLMNILAGYKSIGKNKKYQITGSILINGQERNRRQFRRKSCYIMQDDYLIPNFTVKETMMVAANLKLSEKTSKEEKEQTIKDILAALRLTEAENTDVGKLSGGERKRMCMAQELVNNPPVMFFDEPTSGLDSSSSDQCISLLKYLAKGGRTIVCTIHQPNSKLFEKFDKLIVVAEGQCIYRGMTSGMVPFLSSVDLECPPYHNPADFVIDIASEENGVHLPTLVNAVISGKCDFWDQNPLESKNIQDDPKTEEYEKITITEAESNPSLATSKLQLWNPSAKNEDNESDTFEHATGFWTQFWILFVRSFLSLIRNKLWFLLRLFCHTVLGVLLGALYYNIGQEADDIFSNLGCMFFILLFYVFVSSLPVVLLFPLERRVVEREYLNSWYSAKAYYFAKVTADSPFQIIFPFMFSTIIYWMTNQPNELFRYLLFILVTISTALVSQAVGFMIGAGVEIQVGVFLCAVFNIPLVVFCGFFVSYYTIPIYLRWFCYVSYMFYAFEATMVTIYGFDRDYLECPDQLCIIDSPAELLDQLEIVHRNLYVDYIGLICFFVTVRLAGYFILRWRLNSKL